MAHAAGRPTCLCRCHCCCLTASSLRPVQPAVFFGRQLVDVATACRSPGAQHGFALPHGPWPGASSFQPLWPRPLLPPAALRHCDFQALGKQPGGHVGGIVCLMNSYLSEDLFYRARGG
ncbi:hypothetical protein NDU88_007771 [Pleurodeles waltl]|uniref:Secreted protein n=1 Tax=Pleurodeles waltl TaxID=8319 RepID=A0AAV7VQN8_PLEWA|nr:hypothetical protein NDU88_007771 [Pleurodeles waltl]